jgi:hypothetical protein
MRCAHVLVANCKGLNFGQALDTGSVMHSLAPYAWATLAHLTFSAACNSPKDIPVLRAHQQLRPPVCHSD